MALVAVTLALLAALVWALNPSRPGLKPAPLRPQPLGCPRSAQEFTPTNITELPDLASTTLSEDQKYRALFRLNMEPCPCGCGMSVAACRLSHPTCETSKELARKIVAEVEGEKGRPRWK